MKTNILILFLLLPFISFGQEVISDLSVNPVVKNTEFPLKKQKNVLKNLPFIDDFSALTVFPDNTLWSNNYVFVNAAFPKFPITLGVATLDALNDTGALYQEASTSGFIADSLTSQPIQLDSILGVSPSAIKKSDSVYFSFYYQPQGVGNAPEKNDSLVLEFYSPKTAKWHHIWSDTGTTAQNFYDHYQVWFKQVMIPITDSLKYFHKGFRFRFYNYASLSTNTAGMAGNADQWHIDYVYLDKGRNKADSIYKDIAFVEPAESVLKNYTAMPWSQFKLNAASEMKDTLRMTITNLDTIIYNSAYKYAVKQENGTWSSNYDGGSYNIYPYKDAGYQTYVKHASPDVNFSFPLVSGDSASFTIKHSIKEGILGDSYQKNDTTSFKQHFYNYYAYDDGVPESGYGITPKKAMLAYEFTLNHTDTLRAVQFYFNQTLYNISQQYFNLCVWKHLNGFPDSIIYKQSRIKPIYEDSLNQYHTYRIEDTTLMVNGTFYVGWEQTTDDFLNVGFDKNNDRHEHVFYNTADGSGWKNSLLSGALMIRPLLGKKLPEFTAIKEYKPTIKPLIAYPNPSNGHIIHLSLTDINISHVSDLHISIYDMLGNKIQEMPYKENISLAELHSGIYLVYVKSDDNTTSYFCRLSIIK